MDFFWELDFDPKQVHSGKYRQGDDLRASRWQHHLCRRRTLPLPRSLVPAFSRNRCTDTLPFCDRTQKKMCSASRVSRLSCAGCSEMLKSLKRCSACTCRNEFCASEVLHWTFSSFERCSFGLVVCAEPSSAKSASTNGRHQRTIGLKRRVSIFLRFGLGLRDSRSYAEDFLKDTRDIHWLHGKSHASSTSIFKSRGWRRTAPTLSSWHS